jgi:predicted DNA-binding transcriptional regulator AlpA
MDRLNEKRLLKLKDVLKVIPVSKATWWNGVRSGRYPRSVKDGRCTFWRLKDILELINEITERSKE